MVKSHRIPVKVASHKRNNYIEPQLDELEEKDVALEAAQAEVTTEEKISPPVEEKKRARKSHEAEVDWRERAMRLQAEMENYRKRQRRLADERVAREREALLFRFLSVVDNLEKVLSHIDEDNPAYHGIRVTYDAAKALLRVEDVVPIQAVGEPFDPDWHDAVTVIPAQPGQEEEMLVIDEALKGYRIGDGPEARLLRPARVVVAKQ
jgi:molecular chaperone GrpE